MKNNLNRRFRGGCRKLICGIAVAAVALGTAACSGEEDKEVEVPKAEKAATVTNGDLKEIGRAHV